MRVLLEQGSHGAGQKSEEHHDAHENRRAALAFDKAIHEYADHAGEHVVADPEKQHGRDSEPKARGSESVEAYRKTELHGEEEKPEGVKNADEVARGAAVGGGERVAAELDITEDGVHSEA